MPAEAALERVRAICLALPATSERSSHGSPTFFAGARAFVMFMDDHHGDGRLAIWCAAPLGAQADLVRADRLRHFVPPYVGYRGWVGVLLDGQPAWPHVAAVIRDAYRVVAPKRALAELDAQAARGR